MAYTFIYTILTKEWYLTPLLLNMKAMNYKKIQNTHYAISELILNREILNATDKLLDFANCTNKRLQYDKIEKIKETYSNILQHSFSGVKDPERDKI